MMEETQGEDASDKKEERRRMSTWSENGPSGEAPTGDTEGGRRRREWGRKSGEEWGVQNMETGRVGTEEKWESNREEERHALTENIRTLIQEPSSQWQPHENWNVARREDVLGEAGVQVRTRPISSCREQDWERKRRRKLGGEHSRKMKEGRGQRCYQTQSQTPVLLGICTYSAQDGAATQLGIP